MATRIWKQLLIGNRVVTHSSFNTLILKCSSLFLLRYISRRTKVRSVSAVNSVRTQPSTSAILRATSWRTQARSRTPAPTVTRRSDRNSFLSDMSTFITFPDTSLRHREKRYSNTIYCQNGLKPFVAIGGNVQGKCHLIWEICRRWIGHMSASQMTVLHYKPQL